ncbi:MAG: hypothetical protein ACTSSG_02070 [Candidatus Heimdallarchaeaceae archaeon]
MKHKAILGSAVLGLTIILLTMSGTVTQAQISSMQAAGRMNLTVDPVYIEEMKITAGIDSAALIQLLLLGIITTLADFTNVVNWLFVVSDQENYHPYLLRRPFKAPENATLILEIKGSLGTDGSLAKAVNIALAFRDHYNVGLMWSRAEKLDNGNYLYFFSGGMQNSIFTTLTNEITSDITGGFASLMDASTISSSPVKAIIIGKGMIEGRSLPIRAIYYVDDNAITGTTEFTLSTAAMFGTTVTPMTGLGLKYSILKFRFPYTINPTSITPRTDNFAPQITGKMDWILNAPWQLPRMGHDYVVSYTIDYSTLLSTPRVSVNMAYNQTMLNNDGRLQMDYTITNTGNEPASNIDISYPLSPDFLNFLANAPKLPDLRDDVSIDEGIYTEINGSILVTFSGDLFTGVDPQYYNQVVLVLKGWYTWNANGSWVDYDPLMTDVVVGTDSQVYSYGGFTGTVTTEARLSSPDGLSHTLVNIVTAFLANISLSSYAYTELPNLLSDYEAELWDATQKAGERLYNLLYTEVQTFVPDLMDFGYSERPVGEIGGEAITQFFLNKTIPYLAPNDTITISWALDNIPARDLIFGMMSPSLVNVGGEADAIQLTTIQETGYNLMRFLFGIADPPSGFSYSRPISYYDPWSNIWLSSGARFRYEDPQGFEYFGFSNGINLQIADDEAVLDVNVALNSTAYKVGDPITVNYSVENTGNVAAENVAIFLVHGRMGNDWQIADPDIFWVDSVASIAPGETYYGTANVLANSFLGIHPVYAVVYFDSDVGQDYTDDTDPDGGYVNFGPGFFTYFEGAAETHQVVLSNMDWAMLLPKTQGRRPAFPQPVLDISVDAHIIVPDDAPWELEVTITITNVGDDVTHITAIQFYNATEMELKTKTSTKGSYVNATQYGMGVIVFQGITLAPGESVEIYMRWMFLTSSGCYVPGIQVIYDSRFENELGEDEIQGEGELQTPLVHAMNGQSQDEQDWEDYGQSTQTGSSAGADVFTGGEHTRRLGSADALYWSLGAIFVTAVVFSFRRRFKK